MLDHNPEGQPGGKANHQIFDRLPELYPPCWRAQFLSTLIGLLIFECDIVNESGSDPVGCQQLVKCLDSGLCRESSAHKQKKNL